MWNAFDRRAVGSIGLEEHVEEDREDEAQAKLHSLWVLPGYILVIVCTAFAASSGRVPLLALSTLGLLVNVAVTKPDLIGVILCLIAVLAVEGGPLFVSSTRIS